MINIDTVTSNPWPDSVNSAMLRFPSSSECWVSSSESDSSSSEEMPYLFLSLRSLSSVCCWWVFCLKIFCTSTRDFNTWIWHHTFRWDTHISEITHCIHAFIAVKANNFCGFQSKVGTHACMCWWVGYNGGFIDCCSCIIGLLMLQDNQWKLRHQMCFCYRKDMTILNTVFFNWVIVIIMFNIGITTFCSQEYEYSR